MRVKTTEKTMLSNTSIRRRMNNAREKNEWNKSMEIHYLCRNKFYQLWCYEAKRSVEKHYYIQTCLLSWIPLCSDDLKWDVKTTHKIIFFFSGYGYERVAVATVDAHVLTRFMICIMYKGFFRILTVIEEKAIHLHMPSLTHLAQLKILRCIYDGFNYKTDKKLYEFRLIHIFATKFTSANHFSSAK